MIKKHFVPGEENNQRPYILRKEGIKQILMLVIICELVAFAGIGLLRLDGRLGTASVIPTVLSDLTNKERQEQNLGPLAINEDLNRAATLKAQDMADKQYFAHTSPEGKTPWYWIEQVGYKYQYAGENLAVDFSDSAQVARAWMESPTHKANIIKKKYTEVGTGIAEGEFEGKKTIFVAQVYANPLPSIQTPESSNLATLAAKQESLPAPTPQASSSQQVPAVQVTSPQAEPDDIPGHLNIGEINKLVYNPDAHSQVLGAEVSPDPEVNDVPLIHASSVWQRVVASPTKLINMIIGIIAGMMVFALLMYLILQRKNLHFDLLTNGLAVIAVAGGILILNYFMSTQGMVIIQSIDYENTNIPNS